MNYEVFCFDWVEDSLQVVHKEYCDTYANALAFQMAMQDVFEGGISITPMNEQAEKAMY